MIIPNPNAINQQQIEEDKEDIRLTQFNEPNEDSEDEEDSDIGHGASGANTGKPNSTIKRKRNRKKLTNQKIEKLAKELRSISTYALPGKEPG